MMVDISASENDEKEYYQVQFTYYLHFTSFY